MTTLSIKHRVLTTVDTTEVTLPFYYTTGQLSKSYCCMSADFKRTSVFINGNSMNFDVTTYDDAEEAASSIAWDVKNYENFTIIDAAVFNHKFSEAHRELFYCVNPQLKPTE
jgi:hypothetical protein